MLTGVRVVKLNTLSASIPASAASFTFVLSTVTVYSVPTAKGAVGVSTKLVANAGPPKSGTIVNGTTGLMLTAPASNCTALLKFKVIVLPNATPVAAAAGTVLVTTGKSVYVTTASLLSATCAPGFVARTKYDTTPTVGRRWR